MSPNAAARLSGAEAVVIGVSGPATLLGALVPAAFLKHPKGIRDVGEWYISLVERRDYIHHVFDYQCEIALRMLDEWLQFAQQPAAVDQ